MDPAHYMTVVKNSIIRYIKIDLKYLFQIGTDVIWFILDIVAFAFLGSFMDNKTNTSELGLEGLNMVTFMLIGVLFWSFFSRAYEDTVNTIPEEASRGTIGFLVTNNINLSVLLISRNIASTIKTGLMAVLIILPILLVYPGIAGPTPSDYSTFSGDAKGDIMISGVIKPTNSNSTGTYISEEMRGVPSVKWDSIKFYLSGENDTNANVVLYTRTSEGNTNSSWNGWDGPYTLENDTYVKIANSSGRIFQYKLILTSGENVSSPVVHSYTIKSVEPIISLEHPVSDTLLILGVFMMIWIFMLVISLLISSLNIIFKRITPFAVMFMYGLKILSGYYFPVEAINIPGVADAVKWIPVTAGLYLIRGVMSGHPNNVSFYISAMIIGTIIMAIISFIVYKVLEKKSQTWGTLEFY